MQDLVLGSTKLKPVTGDWDSSGSVTLGFYDSATGIYFLSNDNASISGSSTIAGANSTDLPLAFAAQTGAAPQLSLMDPLASGRELRP